MIGGFTADEDDVWYFEIEEHRSDFGRWDLITATWSGRLAFYDAQMGALGWGRVDGGHFQDEGGASVPHSFQQMLPAGNEYIVFYERVGGSVLALRVSERGVEGAGTAIDATPGIFAASSNGLLLFLMIVPLAIPPKLTGGARAYGVFDGGGGTPLERLHEYPVLAFGVGWERTVALGALS